MPLSDTACRTAKFKADTITDTIKLTDGEGLYLMLTRSGAKLWRMNYRHAGKQKTLSFGRYPEVGLARAREQRAAARAKLAEGLDPSRPDAPPPSEGPTFEQIAAEWFDIQAETWVPKHAAIILGRLRAEVFPAIGDKPIRDVTAEDVLAVIRAVESRDALNVSRKLRQTLGQIFSFAIATSRATINPAAMIKAAAKPAPRARHHHRVTDLVDFMARLRGYDGEPLTPLAIEMVMRTAVRTSELRFGTWSEIEGDLWRIPGPRMKEHLEHLVPLAPQVVDLLDRARPLGGGSALLFPGDRKKAMSENTMLFALYRMGLRSRATIHGLRRVFSTAANESGLFAADWIEMQLAHTDADPVRGAYNAAQYLPQRRDMMAWWNDQIDAAQMQSAT